MRVLIYHRIDGRRSDGINRELMERHLSNLETTAKGMGHTVTGMFYDFSSGCTVDRPGLENLMEAVETGVAEGIMVKDLSRLARDRDTLEQIQERIRAADGRLLGADNCLSSGG